MSDEAIAETLFGGLIVSLLSYGTRCSLFFLFARVLFARWLVYVSEKRKRGKLRGKGAGA